MEDSRGTLCRNRRLSGTLERLRCGWSGQDREGGEGRELAGSPCLFFKELGFPVNRIGFENRQPDGLGFRYSAAMALRPAGPSCT
jgi:hypothetical protein